MSPTLLAEFSSSIFILAKLLLQLHVISLDDAFLNLWLILSIDLVKALHVLLISPTECHSVVRYDLKRVTYLICSTLARICSSFFYLTVFIFSCIV